MNTVVCNTLSGAVSEYSRHDFHAITATHGGSAAGLFALASGDTDDGLPIVAELRLPATIRENTLKKHLEMVYLSMRGRGCAQFAVLGPNAERWAYSFPLVASGQTRCQPGRGIRQNYLSFGLSTPAGQAFTLDRIEVATVSSKNRRVGA